MHALVTAVLVGAGQVNEEGSDAELDPPDVEPGQTVDGLGGEGGAVVGADGVRKAKFGENTFKNGPGGRVAGAGEGVDGEEIAGEAIGDDEGIAVDAVEGLELAFEIGGPDLVGSSEGNGLEARMLGLAPSAARLDQAVFLEELPDGADGGPVDGGAIEFKEALDLLGPQLGMAPLALQQDVCAGLIDLVGG